MDFTVRDYECDLQGIVNNATYLNYLEHTRHEFLKSAGVDFALMHQKGINLVVVRSEIDYKFSLASGDKFFILRDIHLIYRSYFEFCAEILGRLSTGGRNFSTAIFSARYLPRRRRCWPSPICLANCERAAA